MSYFPLPDLIRLGILQKTDSGYVGPGPNAHAIMVMLISMNVPVPEFQTVLNFRNAQPDVADESQVTAPDWFGGFDEVEPS